MMTYITPWNCTGAWKKVCLSVSEWFSINNLQNLKDFVNLIRANYVT